jgi:hypothetical protein
VPCLADMGVEVGQTLDVDQAQRHSAAP